MVRDGGGGATIYFGEVCVCAGFPKDCWVFWNALVALDYGAALRLTSAH